MRFKGVQQPDEGKGKEKLKVRENCGLRGIL